MTRKFFLFCHYFKSSGLTFPNIVTRHKCVTLHDSINSTTLCFVFSLCLTHLYNNGQHSCAWPVNNGDYAFNAKSGNFYTLPI
jgi:hypothetical protein